MFGAPLTVPALFDMQCDMVVAINVFEDVVFLQRQLENIHQALVRVNYRVFLHCSVSFYNTIAKDPLFVTHPRLHICSPPFDKRRFHGSLLQGIMMCMLEARQRYVFDVFLILSSRTFFHRPLALEDAYTLPRNYGFAPEANHFPTDWWWPHFTSTKLCHWVQLQPNLRLGMSMHEGLALPVQSVDYVLNFAEVHTDIFDDLFAYELCVEEMAIQTILSNAASEQNVGPYFFWDWGSGSDEYVIVDKSFVWKVARTLDGLQRAHVQFYGSVRSNARWSLFIKACLVCAVTVCLLLRPMLPYKH